jgi:DNA-binding transcriptional ArsR family regulator
MTIRLLLVKDDEVLMELPLSAGALSKDRLQQELDSFEEEFDRVTKLFDALSHTTRLRMVKRLFEEEDLTLGFTDFIKELGLNPKIVWQNTKKLCDGGLMEKDEDGRYSCSEAGRAQFLMLSLMLRQLRDIF